MISGYVLDLTGQEGRLGGDTVNTIYTEAYTFIDYTGTVEEINQSDSFYSFIEFDLTTEYAKGYIGKDTIDFGPEIITTDIFNIIESGDIDLEEASMNIHINNYIGADAIMKINSLSALNDDLEVSAMIDGNMYDIQRASLTSNNSIIPTNTQINIDADEIIEILPSKINTSATFYVNPNGSSAQQDFIYPSQSINGKINLEIPLNLIANNLAFVDTTNMTLPNEEEYEIDKIFLTINNGFPFDAEIKFILLDEYNLIVDTLLNNTFISSASTDENNIVIENSTTTIEMDYSNFESVRKIVTYSKFSTVSNNEHIKLYSSYNLDVTLMLKSIKKWENNEKFVWFFIYSFLNHAQENNHEINWHSNFIFETNSLNQLFLDGLLNGEYINDSTKQWLNLLSNPIQFIQQLKWNKYSYSFGNKFLAFSASDINHLNANIRKD